MPPLSSTYNNDIIDNKIKVGNIITLDEENISHPKWHLILDISDNHVIVATLMINTEVFQEYLNSAEILKYQLGIKKENIPCLDHDSIIDCFRLRLKEYTEIKEILLTKGSDRLKGSVPEAELSKIIDLIRLSPDIKPKIAKKFKNLFQLK
jgi:hypothetical protein